MKVTRLGELAQASAAEIKMQNEIEEQLKSFVHRESMFRGDIDQQLPEDVVDAIKKLQGIIAASLAIIDGAVGELHSMRSELLARGDHIRHEVRDYANAHEQASAALKTVENILGQWKSTLPANEAV